MVFWKELQFLHKQFDGWSLISLFLYLIYENRGHYFKVNFGKVNFESRTSYRPLLKATQPSILRKRTFILILVCFVRLSTNAVPFLIFKTVHTTQLFRRVSWRSATYHLPSTCTCFSANLSQSLYLSNQFGAIWQLYYKAGIWQEYNLLSHAELLN